MGADRGETYVPSGEAKQENQKNCLWYSCLADTRRCRRICLLFLHYILCLRWRNGGEQSPAENRL